MKKTSLDNFLNINNDNSVETDEQNENKNNKNEIVDVEDSTGNKKTRNNNNRKAAFHGIIDNDVSFVMRKLLFFFFIQLILIIYLFIFLFKSNENTSNWLEDRKPINASPENAKPISEKCDTEVVSFTNFFFFYKLNLFYSLQTSLLEHLKLFLIYFSNFYVNNSNFFVFFYF